MLIYVDYTVGDHEFRFGIGTNAQANASPLLTNLVNDEVNKILAECHFDTVNHIHKMLTLGFNFELEIDDDTEDLMRWSIEANADIQRICSEICGTPAILQAQICGMIPAERPYHIDSLCQQMEDLLDEHFDNQSNLHYCLKQIQDNVRDIYRFIPPRPEVTK